MGLWEEGTDFTCFGALVLFKISTYMFTKYNVISANKDVLLPSSPLFQLDHSITFMQLAAGRFASEIISILGFEGNDFDEQQNKGIMKGLK